MEKKGNLCVITPSDFTYEPIEFSENEKKEYMQYVSEELDKFIETIQFGLSFFDIKASINEDHKNQIDFYDSNNNLLCSKKIECPKNKVEYITVLMKAQFSGEFQTDSGKICWGSEPIYAEGENSENYYFNLNLDDYSKKLFICRRNGKIVDIKPQIYGQKDFNIKKLDVSELKGKWVDFQLDDVFGSEGNHVDGIVRHLAFNKSIFNNDVSARVKEGYAYKKANSLDSSHTSWDRIERDRITIWQDKKRKEINVSNADMLDYIQKILSHPRSKEIISYLEIEMEREFPGIMNYIKTNFNIYNEITGLTYEEDLDFENLYKSIILPECDLPVNKEKKLNRKQK